jgi:hypothetical protein
LRARLPAQGWLEETPSCHHRGESFRVKDSYRNFAIEDLGSFVKDIAAFFSKN